MDTKTTNSQNEGAPQKQLRAWGTLIPFPSAFTITPFINRWRGGGMLAESPPLSINEALRPANSENPYKMSAVTAYAPLLTRTPQVWIRGKLWHATRLSCCIPVARGPRRHRSRGGGDYASLAFTKIVETNLRGGKSIINPSEKGFLRAGNPQKSGVFPMYVCMYVWSSHIAEYGSTG